MNISEEHIRQVLTYFFRRCELVKAAGGIALVDIVNGAEIPEGWIYDTETDYYLPPNAIIDTNQVPS